MNKKLILAALIAFPAGAYAGTALEQAGGVSQENRYYEELPAPSKPETRFDEEKAAQAYRQLSEAYQSGRNPGGLAAVAQAQPASAPFYAETVTVDVSGQEGIVGHGVGRLSVEYRLPQGLGAGGSYEVRYYFKGGPEYKGTVTAADNAADITGAKATLKGEGVELKLTFRKSKGVLVAEFATTLNGRPREEGYLRLTADKPDAVEQAK